MIDISVSLFLNLLDFFGTAAFALTGAFKAIEKKADLFGIIVLATITGVAGGVTRDVIFGIFPPMVISNPMYVSVTLGSGLIIFFLYSKIKKAQTLFLNFDAIGLGVFTVIGASVAYGLFGVNFLPIVLGGMITAIGGGIIRDILANQTPVVLVKELYASASFLGVVIFFLVLLLGGDQIYGMLLGLISTSSLRFFAMKYKWNLPKAKYL